MSLKLGEGLSIEGRYVLEVLLGEGGFGEVWRAQDTKLPRKVALKFIRRQAAAQASLLKRFEREADVLVTLDHQNVVRVHDKGYWADRPYLVLEYIEGGSLRSWQDGYRAAGERPPIDTVRALILQIASGVAEAHRQDPAIIHRDLKPDNVLLKGTSEGRLIAKVLDFGLARVGTGQSSVVMTIGTFAYMSPEQASKGVNAVTTASDVFALGVMLAEMLSGRFLPFEGSKEPWERVAARGRTTEALGIIATKHPGVPATVWSALEKALAGSADQRPQTADSFRSALLTAWPAGNNTQPLGETLLDARAVVRRPTLEAPPPPSGRSSYETPHPASPGAPDIERLPESLLSTEPTPEMDSIAVLPSLAVPHDIASADVRLTAPITEPKIRGEKPQHAPHSEPVDDLNATSRYDGSTLRPTGATGARPRRRWVFMTLLGLLAAAGGIAATALEDDDAPTPPIQAAPATYTLRVQTQPTNAAIELDAQRVATGTYQTEIPRNGSSHTLRVTAAGYEARALRFVDMSPPARIVLRPLPNSPPASRHAAATRPAMQPTVPLANVPPTHRLRPPPDTARVQQTSRPRRPSRGSSRDPGRGTRPTQGSPGSSGGATIF